MSPARKKLILVALPLKAINQASARELTMLARAVSSRPARAQHELLLTPWIAIRN
jgi:hypothetical protein